MTGLARAGLGMSARQQGKDCFQKYLLSLSMWKFWERSAARLAVGDEPLKPEVDFFIIGRSLKVKSDEGASKPSDPKTRLSECEP